VIDVFGAKDVEFPVAIQTVGANEAQFLLLKQPGGANGAESRRRTPGGALPSFLASSP